MKLIHFDAQNFVPHVVDCQRKGGPTAVRFKVIRPNRTQAILVPRRSVTFPSWIPLGPGWLWSETQRHTSERDVTKFKSSRVVLGQNITEEAKFISSRPRHTFVWTMSVFQQQRQYSSALADNSLCLSPKLRNCHKIIHSFENIIYHSNRCTQLQNHRNVKNN